MSQLRAEAKYTPTPAEIREHCLAIQAGWSEVEERSRRNRREYGEPVECRECRVSEVEVETGGGE